MKPIQEDSRIMPDFFKSKPMGSQNQGFVQDLFRMRPETEIVPSVESYRPRPSIEEKPILECFRVKLDSEGKHILG